MPSITKFKLQSPSFLLPPPSTRAPTRQPVLLCSRSKSPSRRKFLHFALATVLLPTLHTSRTHAREWLDSDLCGDCRGSGNQYCAICDGTGTLSLDDGVIQRADQCPNCMGKGRVRCLSCIGLGLADVRGILRDGTSLRLLSNVYHISNAFSTLFV